jgi:hypothetical protein
MQPFAGGWLDIHQPEIGLDNGLFQAFNGTNQTELDREFSTEILLGCDTFMKITLLVLLSGLLLCGCSQKQEPLTGTAIDLVQAGKDISWSNGEVLHIKKRDGSSLKGIQFSSTDGHGQKITVTADTGTVTSGSLDDAADTNAVRITLYNAKPVTTNAHMTPKNMKLEIVLCK